MSKMYKYCDQFYNDNVDYLSKISNKNSLKILSDHEKNTTLKNVI